MLGLDWIHVSKRGPIGDIADHDFHYNDVIMSALAPHITSLTIVYSTAYSGADQRKHQSSASLAFVRGIHRWPVHSQHKWPVTRKMFPFDDVILRWCFFLIMQLLHFQIIFEGCELIRFECSSMVNHNWFNSLAPGKRCSNFKSVLFNRIMLIIMLHVSIYSVIFMLRLYCHDDVIKLKHFPRHWPFVRGIHRRVIPQTKARDAELWCFLWSTLE